MSGYDLLYLLFGMFIGGSLMCVIGMMISSDVDKQNSDNSPEKWRKDYAESQMAMFNELVKAGFSEDKAMDLIK